MRNKKSIIAAVIGIAAVLSVIGGRYVYNEYHTYYSPQAREYEAVAEENGIFILLTQKKELLGNTYAAFSVKEKESGQVIYQCPDLFLVKDLESIGWAGTGFDIEVAVRGKSPVTYYYREDNSWTTQP